MKNSNKNLVEIIVMFAFIALGAAFSYFGNNTAALITMAMAGIAVIGYTELLANPEGGLAEFLDIRG